MQIASRDTQMSSYIEQQSGKNDQHTVCVCHWTEQHSAEQKTDHDMAEDIGISYDSSLATLRADLGM